MNIVQVWNPQPKEVLRIEFMIGNTCNFSCWYCFEGSHEGTHRWTDDMDQLVLNFKHLFEKYRAIGKTKLELHIVGGEPTLLPNVPKQDDQLAMLTTGEAVIPAEIAQHPVMKPVISAIVDTGRAMQDSDPARSAPPRMNEMAPPIIQANSGWSPWDWLKPFIIISSIMINTVRMYLCLIHQMYDLLKY